MAIQIPTTDEKQATRCLLTRPLQPGCRPISTKNIMPAANPMLSERERFADDDARQSMVAYWQKVSAPPSTLQSGELAPAAFLHIDYRSAAAFCSNIREFGKEAAHRRRAGGWTLSAIGVVTAAAFAAVASKETDGGDTKSSLRSGAEGAAA